MDHCDFNFEKRNISRYLYLKVNRKWLVTGLTLSKLILGVFFVKFCHICKSLIIHFINNVLNKRSRYLVTILVEDSSLIWKIGNRSSSLYSFIKSVI